MPAMNLLDRLLDRLLADLAERLAASGEDRILVRPDDLATVGSDGEKVFRGLGLLAPCEPTGTTICDGCDRGCTMEVRFAAANAGAPSRAFVVCDKRDDIGRVPVAAERLRQWQVSLERIAELVARLLGTSREPKPGVCALAWDLGAISNARESVEIRLVPILMGGRPFHGVTITLGARSDGCESGAITLPSLLCFRGQQLRLNRAALRRVLNGRFDDSRVAWEIRFEGGDIVLINHVIGRPTTIASPNFNSTNDNAFQVLYANPGRRFSLLELRDEARDRTISDFHKMVENLKFRGDLKKAFFRVSRNAICFERTATVGRLATLRIDPKAQF